jgi:hypothetical protein
MAGLGPKLPWATPWKRYQIPFTRLERGKGIRAESSVGPWNHPSGTGAMDIYVNDDVFFTLSSTINPYKFTMTNGGLANDFIGASANHWQSNRYWIDGFEGVNTAARKMRLSQPANDTDEAAKACINVVNPGTDSVYFKKRDTENSLGNKAELITIEPGLHFAFNTTDPKLYETDDYYEFTLDYDYLRKLPKQYDGTWSCWMHVPRTAGDYTYSQDLPSELNLRNFSVYINPIRFGPKQFFTDIDAATAKDFGLTAYLISKPKGEDWLGEHDVAHALSSTTSNETVRPISLDTDFSIGDFSNMQVPMHHSADDAGAERQHDLRLELTFPDITVGPAIMMRGQYIQVVIIPH